MGLPGDAVFYKNHLKLSEATQVVAAEGSMGQTIELQWGGQKVALLNCDLAWNGAAHEVDFVLASQSLKPLWVKPVRPITGLGALPCPGEPSDHLAKTAIFSR
ncbi:MAG: hypothetical protein AB7F31_07490 [Parachlamydiales bacterium]